MADNKFLIKAAEKHEIDCSITGKALEINIIDITKHKDGIAVENFTNEHIMFESAEVSEKLNPDEFTVEDIFKSFDELGFDILFFDALIGNGDRHAGNFGYLRNSNNGDYIGMAPLFDFDHAFESNNTNDILIEEIREHKKQYINRFKTLVNASKSISVKQLYVYKT